MRQTLTRILALSRFREPVDQFLLANDGVTYLVANDGLTLLMARFIRLLTQPYLLDDQGQVLTDDDLNPLLAE